MEKLDILLKDGYSVEFMETEGLTNQETHIQAVVSVGKKWIFTAAGKNSEDTINEAYENLPNLA